jgi:hypothetical protein
MWSTVADFLLYVHSAIVCLIHLFTLFYIILCVCVLETGIAST